MEILLVDDHNLFRDGLALVVGRLGEEIEILQAGDSEQAVHIAEQHPELDLVLLDYNIPGNAHFSTFTAIKDTLPATPIALISATQDSQLVQEGLHLGASGFLTKDSDSEVILSAIQLILSGGLYIPPVILKQSSPPNTSGETTTQQRVIPDSSQRECKSTNKATATAPTKLTERQLEVFSLLGQGFSNKEIAKKLNLSPSTIKVHVAAILRECNAANRTQAVSNAKQFGISLADRSDNPVAGDDS